MATALRYLSSETNIYFWLFLYNKNTFCPPTVKNATFERSKDLSARAYTFYTHVKRVQFSHVYKNNMHTIKSQGENIPRTLTYWVDVRTYILPRMSSSSEPAHGTYTLPSASDNILQVKIVKLIAFLCHLLSASVIGSKKIIKYSATQAEFAHYKPARFDQSEIAIML